MTPATDIPTNDDGLVDVYDAAATWHDRKARSDWRDADEATLVAWLEADPEHARAYADMAEVGEIVDAAAGNDDLAWEMAQARRALNQGKARKARWSFGLLAASLAGVAILVGAGGWLWWRGGTTETVYAAAPAHRATVILADGSRVALDGGTRIRVALSRSERRIDLDRGRAFFDVAHDAGRPFEVFGGDHVVRAVGTAFEVDVAARTAPFRVALLQGRVRVRGLTGGRATDLSPGQVLVADAAGGERVSSTDVAASTAWREGRLALRGETLETAVEELNRRGGRRIVVEGAARALRISGSYGGDDPETFARAIAAVHGLNVGRTANGVIVLSPGRGAGASAD
jgi:transmembrane sensor